MNIKDIPQPYSYERISSFCSLVYYEETKIKVFILEIDAKNTTFLLNAAFREGYIKHSLIMD
jgi:hypothetical protein